MQEKMLGKLSLRNRPGLDQPTPVGQRHGIITTEPQGGWLTNSQITKMKKVKENNLSHIYPRSFPPPPTRDI